MTKAEGGLVAVEESLSEEMEHGLHCMEADHDEKDKHDETDEHPGEKKGSEELCPAKLMQGATLAMCCLLVPDFACQAGRVPFLTPIPPSGATINMSVAEGVSAYTLMMDQDAMMTIFKLRIVKAGKYAIASEVNNRHGVGTSSRVPRACELCVLKNCLHLFRSSYPMQGGQHSARAGTYFLFSYRLTD